jgi:hypothetical protein
MKDYGHGRRDWEKINMELGTYLRKEPHGSLMVGNDNRIMGEIIMIDEGGNSVGRIMDKVSVQKKIFD